MTYVLCGSVGGYIVISHPLGRKWLEEYLHKKDPVMVPHLLPDQAQLEALMSDLPLRLHSYVDDEHLYIATLQVSRLHISCMPLRRGQVQARWAEVQSSFAVSLTAVLTSLEKL